ncbi:MAG: BatD family protein [Oceanococcus sp.]
MTRLLTLLLIFVALPTQAAVTATLDKNPILAGEVLTLTISSDSNDDEPDLSELEQQFDILGRSSSSQFQMINGRTSRSYDWSIRLRPKRLGMLTIPAIMVGKERSKPIAVEVKKPDVQAGESPEAFIEFEADRSEAWLRSQVLLQVRLFVRGNLVSGSFSEPHSDDAVIEQLGEQQESQAIRGTHRYRVIERRYALFAERSGELNLAGPVFNGEISTGTQQRRGPFGYSAATRGVYAAAEPLSLNILPAPQNLAGANWLPASQVRLQERLQPNVSSLKAGEPLTRIISLTVNGQLHTQLPSLDIPNPAATQAYTEPPQDETHGDSRGLVATRTYSTAIIAGSGDSLVLPAVELDWWDTNSNSLKTARIESRRIAIEAAVVPPAVQPSQETAAPIQIAATKPSTTVDEGTLWLWQIAAIACAAGWLGTLLAWFWVTRRPQKVASTPDNTSSEKALLKTLRQADAMQCRSALLQWARQTSGSQQTLSSLARTTNDADQATALHGLDAAAFGHASEFEREKIMLFVKQYRDTDTTTSRPALAPLYPE